MKRHQLKKFAVIFRSGRKIKVYYLVHGDLRSAVDEAVRIWKAPFNKRDNWIKKATWTLKPIKFSQTLGVSWTK